MSLRTDIVHRSILKPLEYLVTPAYPAQLLALAEDLKQFGQLFPLLVTKDYHVIDGQARLQAFEMAGIDDVEVRFIDESHDPRVRRALCKIRRYESDVDVIDVATELPTDPAFLACLPLTTSEHKLFEDTINNIEIDFKSSKGRSR